jgi:hypothetical protein
MKNFSDLIELLTENLLNGLVSSLPIARKFVRE